MQNMKKNQPPPKVSDPAIVSRVKNYLAENVDKTYVDVSQMARCLKERYREYNNRSDGAFCQLVENAYKIVLHSYGLDGPSSSEGSEEESDVELSASGGIINDQILEMYKMQDKKRPAPPKKPGGKPEEPIDIISSDEEGNSAPKLPKISDQITITPHIPNKQINSHFDPRANEKTYTDKKRKADINKSISKKKSEITATKIVKVTFDDVGGISEILSQICDLVLHMMHPEVYKQLGIKAPQGALLHGPPGTGKTLIANAIAGKLKLPFISVSGTELVGGMSGESEERIRELFERATSVAPCILFIDEIDAVCGNRLNAQKDMEKRMVAQLLACLDALSENEHNILVLAATNNPDTLDPSLRRAGRLEQEITLGIPSLQSRSEILSILCKNMKLDNSVDLKALAQITPGFVGADLQALVNKASTYAVKRAFKEIYSVSKLQVNLPNDSVPHTEPPVLINGDKNENELTECGDSTQVKSAEENCQQNPTSEEAVILTEISNVNPQENVASQSKVSTSDPKDDILNLFETSKPYTAEQLHNLCITHEDFLRALKTTKPCAVREGIVTVPDVTWDDIGSLNQVRKDLQLAVLAPVKYPEQLKKLGLAIPSGVLLFGPPGCGKTLLAKAVANEAGVNFISVKGPELLNMYVGESERAVRTCFRRARNSAPCVIFFDEFDALCPRRTQQDNNGATRVVNQLLTEMDGIESREGVFILAASNRPDIIDPAVLRPGRLDRVIYVGMPAREDRIDVLRKLTKNGTQPQLSTEVDFSVIADMTEGYTGADLAGLVRAAATNALTQHIANGTVDGDIFVTFENFRAALSKCKPSVSAKEQQHYLKLQMKYSSNSECKEMEMETEAINEESMDTV